MSTTLTTPRYTPAVRRDPFGLFENRFDDFFNDFWTMPGWMPAMRMTEMPAVIRARMDVVDKGEAFEITMDMPGVKKEDIDITVEGARVAIKAETKTEKETREGDKLLHTERTATSYARSFELPADVTEAGAEASYKDGVLTLVLPKRQPMPGRKLEIR
jgi:HSP20 family protein